MLCNQHPWHHLKNTPSSSFRFLLTDDYLILTKMKVRSNLCDSTSTVYSENVELSGRTVGRVESAFLTSRGKHIKRYRKSRSSSSQELSASVSLTEKWSTTGLSSTSSFFPHSFLRSLVFRSPPPSSIWPLMPERLLSLFPFRSFLCNNRTNVNVKQNSK